MVALSAVVLGGIAGCAQSGTDRISADTTPTIGAQAGERIDFSSVSLRTASNDAVPMQMLLDDGPVVVVFYRGSWCPYCEKTLDGWDKSIDALNAAGGRLVALTPDAPSHVAETLTKQDLGFTVLSDANADAARALRVNFVVDRATRDRYLGFGIDLERSNANGLWQLPHPGTFIIDRDGTVLYAAVDTDYRNGRADPDEVVTAYRNLTTRR
jgi:peroxiredoxin